MTSTLSNNNPTTAATTTACYPRPMLERPSEWLSLNGRWSFAFDHAEAAAPEQVDFDQTIEVPFAPETPASGLAATQRFDTCWYQRTVDWPRSSQRTLLHFEAVDDHADVWVNGQYAGRVQGATRQSLDITGLLAEGSQAIAVRVFDDPDDMAKPRGKQDWKDKPHSIWYPRTTGLWQTVWLERVPKQCIEQVHWGACVDRWEIAFEGEVAGTADGLYLEIDLRVGERRLASERCMVHGPRVSRVIRLDDPGIDDARNELLWSPERPTLIDAELRLTDGAGEVLDRVTSYTAMRSVATDGDRFMLNGRPRYLRLVLAQGYWEQTGLTPPSDEALRADVELTKQLGFNGVRLHEKVEAERYLYWADRLGLLVWGEMGSAYAFRADALPTWLAGWSRRVQRDRSHPSVVAWVPVNESWGLPDLPLQAAQRDAMHALYHLTKALDPSRPVIGNDGWEMGETDIVAVHDYLGDPERLAARYDTAARSWAELLADERPAGRRLLLQGHAYRGQPIVLSEFGGITLRADRGQGGWGYSEAAGAAELEKAYGKLLAVVNRMHGLAGFCYTQLTDTYQETNGLVKMDRTPKLPLDVLQKLTRGHGGA